MRTLQRWKINGCGDKRKGSFKRVVRKLDSVVRKEIILTCNDKLYRDYNPHEIVPLLLNSGKYLASVRTLYRILKEEKLLHHRSNVRVKRGRSKPPERRATKSDQVWSWDITWLPQTVRGLFFFAYVIVDIYDKYIVGWSVHNEEKDAHSKDLFQRTLSGKNPRILSVHSDNGQPMKGITLMALLDDLKVSVSHSRPRVSNDNAFVESLFKTLKYTAKYPLRFRDIKHAREWMASFVNWYNTEHLHSSIGYVTPLQLRTAEAAEIFNRRNATMQLAKKQHPERWGNRNLKVWGAPREVILNRETGRN